MAETPQSPERYTQLFRDLPTAVFVLSPHGVIVEVNNAAARMAKWDAPLLKGQSLDAWVAPRSKGNWSRFLSRIPDRVGQPVFCEVHTLGLISQTGDGVGYFRAEGSCNAAGSELYVTLTDITSERAGEQLARLGHWHWTTSANTVTWSDEVYRLKGADPETYVPTYEGLAQFYTPENWLRLRNAVEHALRDKTGYELDLETHCLDGTVKWISARGEPLIGVDGVVTGLHGTVQDITERKQLEAALHHRQQIWHQAEEVGAIGAWERDLITNRMIVSEGYVRLMGMPKNEIEFGEWLNFIHPDDVDQVLSIIRDSLETGSMTLEYRIVRNDGQVRTLFAQGRAMKDEAGVPIRTYGVVQDITERKALEEALTKRRQMWIEAEKIGRLGGMDFDIATGRIAISDGLAAILGSQRRWHSIEDILNIVHPEDGPDVAARFRAAIQNGRAESFECRVLRADDGLERVIHSHWRTVFDENGKPVRIFGAVQDITERKRSEQALEQTMRELTAAKAKADEALRAKGLFLAAMSHEIRTPLNSVIGLANLLSSSNLDEQQKDFIETIRTSGELLLSVVNDILDYSKLDEGKVQVEQIPFLLRTAVDDVMRVVAHSASTKGLALQLDYARNLSSGRVIGDPGRLKQVLLNLLSNALKFTATGSVTLKVEPDGASAIRFQVIDTGIGIPASGQSALFEFFTQADSSTTRRFGGTGLGLAISRRLVHLMGGSIGVTSQEYMGSTFWFTANLPALPESVDSTASVTAPQLPVHVSGARALVLDIDEPSSSLLVELLSCLGLRASCAQDAEEALTLLDSAAAGDAFRILFVNPAIPENGWKLADIIRRRPYGGSMAIFIVSANRPRRHRAEPGVDLKRVSHDGYLLKPVSARILAQALSRLPNPATPPKTQEGVLSVTRRVLVVEDNRVNQKVAAASLERLGCRVDIAQDGYEAVNFFENTISKDSEPVYDIILMDCHMPGMDGFAATMEIRKLESALQPNRRRTPIVALTADVLESGMDRCIHSGMDDFLTKPIRLSELEAAFQRWIPMKA